jgi:5-methylcytosine-specific restriction protein A
MSLRRACLGCGKLGRWRHRCPRCQAERDKRKAQARPDLHNDRAERERRRKAVAAHRASVGDWCPGVPELRRPAHPSADLTADHVREVAKGGRPAGRLVVRCGPCNSARSANVRRTLLATLTTTPRPPNFPTHSAPEPPPVVA